MIKSLRNIKSSIIQNLINIPGWRTKRKIVVIESDDWGSIRMPSIDVYNAFVKKGFRVDVSDFNRLDSLESNDDLIALYEVLEVYRDMHGHHPVFTANCVVANPDFKQIKDSSFTHYYYEHVNETLKQYPRRDKVLDLWQEGIANRLFYPQFHGREHLNIIRWISALKIGSDNLKYTFCNNTTYSGVNDYNYMEAFDLDIQDDLNSHIATITDGLNIFKEIFGYSSKSFIAPCYIWSPEIEKSIFEYGIRYIQSGSFQLIPKGGINNYKKKYHYLGEINAHNQLYLLRNCIFEPSLINKINAIDYTIKSMINAFKMNKPAIISSHRINYIGSLVEENRAYNLSCLNNLLKIILEKWPDIEFMTSDQLGDLIISERLVK